MYKRSPWVNYLAILLPVIMATIFYAPVLFDSQIQIHGEGISHGIPLMDMLSRALQGEHSALWTDKMYGGHPIFAEGQGAFAHPVTMVVAGLFPPALAYNLFLWVCCMIAGFGTYGLCRSFNCSAASSLFATVAVVFSTLWIGGRSNLSVGGAITWVPWALWSMNHWLTRADTRSACIFGLAMSLMILAGYPHIVHGTVIYLVIYLLTCLGFRSKRKLWLASAQKRLWTGAIAVVLCAGLSAVQWIPLLELVAESHRSTGVGLAKFGQIPLEYWLRGLFYSFDDAQSGASPVDVIAPAYFPIMGSLLVCIVASTVVFAGRRAEPIAHLVAAVFLVLLGCGDTTPVFNFIYEMHLIPGLHNFRIMFPYLFIGSVGIAVLAAISLDSLCAKWSGEDLGSAGHSLRQMALALIWAGLWLALIYHLHTEAVSSIQYLVAGLWVLGTAAAIYFYRGQFIAVLALLLICIEVLCLRMDMFRFGDSTLLSKPQSVIQLEQGTSFQEFKVVDTTLAKVYSMLSPKHRNVERGLKRMLGSMSPSSNALWGISNIDGNTALPLKRWALAKPVIDAELNGQHTAQPGFRLIDFLSVKFVTVDEINEDTGFQQRYDNRETDVLILENPRARPKFQLFDEVMGVATVEEALAALAVIDSSKLVVENPDNEALPMAAKSREGFNIEVIKDQPDNYEFEISAPAPTWFFIADAHYSGWNAYLDGENTRIFAAQVLGKAVFIPPGTHVLRVAFEPLSFSIGLLVSLFSLAMLCLVIYRTRSRAPVQP